VNLSDRDLRKAQADYGVVEPFHDEHVQPASIDLRLGDQFIIWVGAEDWGRSGPMKPHEIPVADGITIEPGQFMLGTTFETVTIPDHLSGKVEGRSSWGRLGLTVHKTAGFIDPGFTGKVTLELKNDGHTPLWLPVGERICQLVLTQLTSPAEKPYGSPGLGSHYQGQQGVTASAIGGHA
jgi:dCTP deaminase